MMSLLAARNMEVTQHSHPCLHDLGASCADSIAARLPDGSLLIRFTEAPLGFNGGREAAYSIVYTIFWRGPSDRDLVLGAAIDRYGRPSTAAPAWCVNPGADQSCQADEAIMVFARVKDAAGALDLSDAGLAVRLARGN